MMRTLCDRVGVTRYVDCTAHAYYSANTLSNESSVGAHDLREVCEGPQGYIRYAPGRFGSYDIQSDLHTWLVRQLEIWVACTVVFVDVQVRVPLREFSEAISDRRTHLQNSV